MISKGILGYNCPFIWDKSGILLVILSTSLPAFINPTPHAASSNSFILVTNPLYLGTKSYASPSPSVAVPTYGAVSERPREDASCARMTPLLFTQEINTSSPPNLSASGNIIVNAIIPALAFLKSDINCA